jgi:hypothetical protein
MTAHRNAAPAAQEPDTLPEGHVNCRVTKFGDGKISTGQHIPAVGDVYFAKDDTFALPQADAEALEARHYVEIQ